jgi:hypothetical protein
MLAVAGMTFGFAAFSTSLNISSSANVIPNSDDFKLRIYGFATEENAVLFVDSIFMNEAPNFDLLSNEESVVVSDGKSMSGETAVIDNSTLSISNMNVSLSEPSESTVAYLFVIKKRRQICCLFRRG